LALDAGGVVEVHQPAEGEGRDLAHQVVGRRIDGELAELAQPAEIGERGARAEQERLFGDMGVEQFQNRRRRLFDDRRVLRRAADHRHAADLAGAKGACRGFDGGAAVAGETVEGEPFAHLFLVALAIPAIVEHRLGAPLVRHVFEQIGEEGLAGIVGDDGAFGMQALQREQHRRGIVVPGAI
jgi:hypothetical protein